MRNCLLAALIALVPLFIQAQSTFKSGDKYGLKDDNNNVILSPKYHHIGQFIKGFALVYLDKKVGIIDKTGKEIAATKYDQIEEFGDRLTEFRIGSKWGLIDKSGREVAAPKYDIIFLFEEGVAQVELNDKVGVIDETGKEIVSPRYGSILDFKGGLAEVELNGKWGLIDKTGKEIVPPKYEFIDAFKQGVAEVRLDSTHFTTIDKTGKEIGPVKVVQKQTMTNCNCPPPTANDIAEFCIAINENESAEIGSAPDYRFSHKYQEVLWRISCADPQKDSFSVARMKIQCMWNKYRTQFRCRDINATLTDGNVAKYSIDCGRTTFLTEAIKRYQLDMNFIDPADGETLMDFIKEQRERFLREFPSNLNRVRENNRYYHLFKKHGAKHAKQLLQGK